MLAVQRPFMSMGSSKPPNTLFGFTIDPSNSGHLNPFAFSSPPQPPPGPSLLDENDSRFLDSFFDGVRSDQYIEYGGENWDFGWTDLPPDFVGTSVSFGQQTEAVRNSQQCLTFPEFEGHLGIVPDLPDDEEDAATLPDVLAAASILQTGHNNQNQSHNHNHNHNHNQIDNHPHQSMLTSMSETFYPPPQSISPQFRQPSPRSQYRQPSPQPQYRQPSPQRQYRQQSPQYASSLLPTPTDQDRRMSTKPEDYMRHTSVSEAIYGRSPPSATGTTPKPVDLRWGTDSSFHPGTSFVAPPTLATMEDVEESINCMLTCFEPASATNTRAPSPYGEPFKGTLKGIDGEDSRNTKRRKVSGVKSEDEPGSDADVKSRKRRPKGLADGGNCLHSSPPTKRRKSGVAAQSKMARENLTEDQKRENHIKSEQKRRTLIKEGFEDLNELVPELRGGGFSKSAVLIMTADWLEELINGNRNLRAVLGELEARNGL